MGYFPVRYDSRVVIYERKMFIRLATDSSVKRRLILTILIKICRSFFFTGDPSEWLRQCGVHQGRNQFDSFHQSSSDDLLS